MGGQIQVGVLEVPHIIGQDVQPDHVRPEHILLVPGGVDSPPAGHAENVEDTGDAVEPVPPAAVEPNVFAGQPPPVPVLGHGGGAPDGGLKVAGHCNQDVGRHNGKGENLEPLLLSHAPLILEHHKADAAGGGSIELGIVEPAVHVQVGGIVQCPLRPHGRSHIDGHKVNGEHPRQNQEAQNSSQLAAAGKFIGGNQAQEDQQPAQQLITGSFSVDLEQHLTFPPFSFRPPD